MTQTLAIIKPDAISRNLSGQINAVIEKAKFRIAAQKKMQLSKRIARKFYEIHKDRSFFLELIDYMTTGSVLVQVLKSDGDTVADFRKLIGATNPDNAEEGTIRKRFGLSVEKNSIHGSDSDDNAKKEIRFFFSGIEIVE